MSQPITQLDFSLHHEFFELSTQTENEPLTCELTPNERVALTHMPAEKRGAWLAGRVAGKRALVRAVRGELRSTPEPSSIEIHSGNGERPTWLLQGRQRQPRATFSIAHSHHAAFSCASSNEKELLGVDCEFIRPLPGHVVRAFLTPRELYEHESTHALPHMHDALLRWCVKEAYLKARGCGLRTHPKHVEVRGLHENDKTMSITENGINIDTRVEWTIHNDTYILVCVRILKDVVT